MERRSLNAIAATAVQTTMAAEDVSTSTLSEATGIDEATLRDRLDNKSDFTFGELTDVGGFFRLPASSFLQGVA